MVTRTTPVGTKSPPGSSVLGGSVTLAEPLTRGAPQSASVYADATLSNNSQRASGISAWQSWPVGSS
jgi:hypothetical protein